MSLRQPILAGLALWLCACSSRPSESRFKVPPGFSVEAAAPAELTGSIVAFTFDSFGRPVIARENKHPMILIDANGDSVFESAKVFSDKVNTLQGLWFDGRVLYAVGNNAERQCGLYRLEDTDGDDVADTFEQINRFEQTMGEHGPHDIRRGPDGHPTIMLGNHTGVPRELIEETSPARGFRESQLLERYMDARGHAAGILAPGGTLVRLNLDKRRYTLLAGGFRNAYNHAYDREGEAFTFDSDMEWDINMPWYRETRSVHLVPGSDYGWRTGSGKFPPYYLDSLPAMRDRGRGSPVGVEFYQHHAYPENYRDAYLEADWSRGRILISRPRRKGATYEVAETATEFVHGEPLNVTDLEVGPDGFVYFSTGGRDTDGGFFRIRYQPPLWDRIFGSKKPSGALAAARQPQPLSSWGHAALVAMKESMMSQWGPELEKLARDTNADPMDRIQALFLLQRYGPRPNADLLRPLAAGKDSRVRAAAIYVVGLHGSPRAKAIAASGLKDADPFVRRRAAEAIVRMGLDPEQPPFAPLDDIYALLKDNDRFTRWAGRIALEHTPRADWRERALREDDSNAVPEALLALIRTATSEEELEPIFEKLLGWMTRPGLSAEDRLRTLRLFQVAATETRGGVRETMRKQFSDLLIGQFPAQDERLSRELARTLAYCGQPEAIARILDAIPRGEENQPLQLHYAYCLRTIKSGWTPEQKTRLLGFYSRAAGWRGGASFTGFVNLMFDSSLEFFDEEEKQAAYKRIPSFAPALDYKSRMAKQMQQTGWGAPSVLARSKGVKEVSPQEIFEFQMFDPMTLRADAAKGKEIYEKECASCHRFGALGNDFGPDLTTLRARFQKKDILESILWPSRTISDQYESTIVETKTGDIINGLLVKQEGGKLLLKTAEVERPVAVPVSEVKSRRKSKTSIMPEGLLDGYGLDQIANLTAFLQKGAVK